MFGRNDDILTALQIIAAAQRRQTEILEGVQKIWEREAVLVELRIKEVELANRQAELAKHREELEAQLIGRLTTLVGGEIATEGLLGILKQHFPAIEE